MTLEYNEQWHCKLCGLRFNIKSDDDGMKALGELREHLIIRHGIPPQWHLQCVVI